MSKKVNTNDFLSINEFAALAEITASALRHYDRIGVFRPAIHSEGGEGKRRYYSPRQVTTIKMIRVLADIGVPLKTIKELAKNRTPEQLLKLLNKYQSILESDIQFIHESHSVISTFAELLYEGMRITETDLYVFEMPEKRIILGGVNDFSGSINFMGEFASFCHSKLEPKLNTSYPVGGYFESMSAFLTGPSQPTRFFTLDPKGHERREAGLYLTGYTRGYYGQTNGMQDRMAAFAKKNGLIFNGPVYNIYLFDELSIVDPEQYLLQISASVTETSRMPFRRPRRHL